MNQSPGFPAFAFWRDFWTDQPPNVAAYLLTGCMAGAEFHGVAGTFTHTQRPANDD